MKSETHVPRDKKEIECPQKNSYQQDDDVWDAKSSSTNNDATTPDKNNDVPSMNSDWTSHRKKQSTVKDIQALYSTLKNQRNSRLMSIPVMYNPPTLIEYGRLRFLIMDAPTDTSLDSYLRELERHNVKEMVRLCLPTYDKEKLEAKGIILHDWGFRDGASPPSSLVSSWLSLVDSKFYGGTPSDETIGVHCAGGFGRAPVLVAIALIEEGMTGLQAVAYLRERRNGVINRHQITFLDAYCRKRNRKNSLMSCCII